MLAGNKLENNDTWLTTKWLAFELSDR